MRPAVSISSVYHRYTKDWALRDITFDIPSNSVVGLLGANGAGKSTLMGIVCGVMTPTAGQVSIGDVSLRRAPNAAKQKIGFLPQQPPLYLDLTVDEYLRFAARLRNVSGSRIERAVDEAKERCSLHLMSKRLIGHLSGGYRQRVGIAQAIVHSPEVVVLDEATNGIDPTQVRTVRSLIGEIAKDRTVIFSTHILSEVEATCDHILMLRDGSVVYAGDVAGFINQIASNKVIVNATALNDPQELLRIPGVLEVNKCHGSIFEVKTAGRSDIARSIIERGVMSDWGLQELFKLKPSLESVFEKLSAGSNE